MIEYYYIICIILNNCLYCMDNHHYCLYCYKQTLDNLCCSCCNIAYYCNKECQWNDFRIHKYERDIVHETTFNAEIDILLNNSDKPRKRFKVTKSFKEHAKKMDELNKLLNDYREKEKEKQTIKVMKYEERILKEYMKEYIDTILVEMKQQVLKQEKNHITVLHNLSNLFEKEWNEVFIMQNIYIPFIRRKEELSLEFALAKVNNDQKKLFILYKEWELLNNNYNDIVFKEWLLNDVIIEKTNDNIFYRDSFSLLELYNKDNKNDNKDDTVNDAIFFTIKTNIEDDVKKLINHYLYNKNNDDDNEEEEQPMKRKSDETFEENITKKKRMALFGPKIGQNDEEDPDISKKSRRVIHKIRKYIANEDEEKEYNDKEDDDDDNEEEEDRLLSQSDQKKELKKVNDILHKETIKVIQKIVGNDPEKDEKQSREVDKFTIEKLNETEKRAIKQLDDIKKVELDIISKKRVFDVRKGRFNNEKGVDKEEEDDEDIINSIKNRESEYNKSVSLITNIFGKLKDMVTNTDFVRNFTLERRDLAVISSPKTVAKYFLGEAILTVGLGYIIHLVGMNYRITPDLEGFKDVLDKQTKTLDSLTNTIEELLGKFNEKNTNMINGLLERTITSKYCLFMGLNSIEVRKKLEELENIQPLLITPEGEIDVITNVPSSAISLVNNAIVNGNDLNIPYSTPQWLKDLDLLEKWNNEKCDYYDNLEGVKRLSDRESIEFTMFRRCKKFFRNIKGTISTDEKVSNFMKIVEEYNKKRESLIQSFGVDICTVIDHEQQTQLNIQELNRNIEIAINATRKAQEKHKLDISTRVKLLKESFNELNKQTTMAPLTRAFFGNNTSYLDPLAGKIAEEATIFSWLPNPYKMVTSISTTMYGTEAFINEKFDALKENGIVPESSFIEFFTISFSSAFEMAKTIYYSTTLTRLMLTCSPILGYLIKFGTSLTKKTPTLFEWCSNSIKFIYNVYNGGISLRDREEYDRKQDIEYLYKEINRIKKVTGNDNPNDNEELKELILKVVPLLNKKVDDTTTFYSILEELNARQSKTYPIVASLCNNVLKTFEKGADFLISIPSKPSLYTVIELLRNISNIGTLISASHTIYGVLSKAFNFYLAIDTNMTIINLLKDTTFDVLKSIGSTIITPFTNNPYTTLSIIISSIVLHQLYVKKITYVAKPLNILKNAVIGYFSLHKRYKIEMVGVDLWLIQFFLECFTPRTDFHLSKYILKGINSIFTVYNGTSKTITDLMSFESHIQNINDLKDNIEMDLNVIRNYIPDNEIKRLAEQEMAYIEQILYSSSHNTLDKKSYKDIMSGLLEPPLIKSTIYLS